ncbi:unnamed protein product [Peniophora sp. CBMAI 1063]|nr:unnamed protein product [Peniophora sp. CBMAI 1063]
MSPITYNVFGDITTILLSVRGLGVTLEDARGVAKEYKQVARVLSTLEAVIGEVHALAQASSDKSLEQAVVEEVERCCMVIDNTFNSFRAFERLEDVCALSPTRHTTQGLFKKHRWRFLRASDASRNAKSFNESLQRFNKLLSILSHQATPHQMNDQRCPLKLAPGQRPGAHKSADNIAGLSLSASEEASSSSPTQVMGQILSRPFFAVPHARRATSRGQRITDMIFDSLAPNKSKDRRRRFLSSLSPFLVAGAAYVVFENVGYNGRITALWIAICALVVQIIWLQSRMPMHTGSAHDNSIIIIGLLGEDIVVPYQFCRSFETLHQFLGQFYSETPPLTSMDFVNTRLYELYIAGTSDPIASDTCFIHVRPGVCLEMVLLLVSETEENKLPACPWCDVQYESVEKSSAMTCAGCYRDLIQTRKDIAIARWTGIFTVADIVSRCQDTDFNVALSQMDTPVTDMTTMAQLGTFVDIVDPSFRRRCHRIHAVNIFWHRSYTPEDVRSVSQWVAETLLAKQATFTKSNLGYELKRSYIRSINKIDASRSLYKEDLSLDKRIYDAVLEEIAPSATTSVNPDGPALSKPMTVVEQLLAEMVSTLNAFIDDPSEKNLHRWEDVVKDDPDAHASFDMRKEYEALLDEHRSISRSLCSAFGFT